MRGKWRCLLVILSVAFVGSAAQAAEFQVVAHASVEGSQVRRSVLASIYEGDVVRWGNRVRILPVDQSSQAPVRLAFSREVLGRSLGELQEFWTRRLPTNRTMPPPTRPSDEEVLAFVASKKGAIGYVSPGVEIPDDVKVLSIIE